MPSDFAEFFGVIKKAALGRVETPESDAEAALLDSDRQARRFGYAIVLLVFVGGGSWAAFAPLQSAAHAPGTVQVEGYRKPVQHLEGGIVAEIYVANGDHVNEGDPLIRFDAAQAKAELRIVEGRMWAKRALVDRLISERDDLEAINFAPWLMAVPDERAQVAIASEKALFNARLADRLGEIEVLQQRIAQLDQQIEGTTLVIQAKRSVTGSLETEIQELNQLLLEGYVDKQRIRQLDRSLAQTLGEISDLEARLSTAQVSIGETRLQILQLTKRFKTQVVDSLTTAQEEFFDFQQRYEALNDRVDRTVVKAPVAGAVLALKPNTIGAVISPGQELMAIVPDAEQFVIDAKLSPMDIDRIAIGQEAEVRFAVFKDAYTVTGKLVRVSADSLIDEVTGAPYYEAKVELLQEDMKFLQGYQLVPGMPTEVLIKTGDRTLLGYLTSPLNRMFANSLIED